MNGICHVEIPCTDFERMKKFYGDVFGWETQIIPEMDYAMFKAPDGCGGGFSKQAKIMKEAGVVVYIEVEDINATLEKIKSSGGKSIQPRTEISPEYGFFALFNDVEGNLIALWGKK